MCVYCVGVCVVCVWCVCDVCVVCVWYVCMWCVMCLCVCVVCVLCMCVVCVVLVCVVCVCVHSGSLCIAGIPAHTGHCPGPLRRGRLPGWLLAGCTGGRPGSSSSPSPTVCSRLVNLATVSAPARGEPGGKARESALCHPLDGKPRPPPGFTLLEKQVLTPSRPPAV